MGETALKEPQAAKGLSLSLLPGSGFWQLQPDCQHMGREMERWEMQRKCQYSFLRGSCSSTLSKIFSKWIILTQCGLFSSVSHTPHFWLFFWLLIVKNQICFVCLLERIRVYLKI